MKRITLFVGCALLGLVGTLAALKVNDLYAGQKTVDRSESLFAAAAIRPVALETSGAPVDFRGAARKLLPSVVSVDTLQERQTWFGDRVIEPAGKASGVIVSKNGYIVSNNHVVQGADAVRVRLNDGRSLTAKVVGTDPRSDLAVLKVEANDLTPAEMGASSSLQIGEWVLAVGNPLGYDSTVSVGVVSSLNRTLPTQGSLLIDAIQTDAAINQGNSGGALANAQGQLVGINTAIASNTGGSVGIGFAIPVDHARKVVDEIIKYGRARYGSLGLKIDSRPGLLAIPQLRRELQETVGAEPPSSGVLVRVIAPESPASKIGLKVYDVLIDIDGTALKQPFEFQTVMNGKKPGDTIKLKYWSRGETKTVSVRLEDLSQL